MGIFLSVAEAGLTGGAAGALGPIFNPLDLSFRKAANAGVLYWAGRLYALSDVRRGDGLPGYGRDDWKV